MKQLDEAYALFALGRFIDYRIDEGMSKGILNTLHASIFKPLFFE